MKDMMDQKISAVTILQFWYRFGIGTIPTGIDVSDRSRDVTNPLDSRKRLVLCDALGDNRGYLETSADCN